MTTRLEGKNQPVTLLVLGDIGRSPRMQLHASSLAEHGFSVDLVGYNSTPVWPAIARNERIRVHGIRELWKPWPGAPRALFLAWAPFKIALQLLQLLWVLVLQVHRPAFVMVQNPPAIPTLVVAQLVCWLRGCSLIIDWHNFGYTILGLSVGPDSWVVKAAQRIEMWAGRHAALHITVTRAMKQELVNHWHVQGRVIVLHDHAPSHFKQLDVEETHTFLQGLRVLPITGNKATKKHAVYQALQNPTATRTFLTEHTVQGLPARFSKDRPALVVSSTSWTADEDFGMLLDALIHYDTQARDAGNDLPTVVCMITGRGPLKHMYEQVIENLQLAKVFICTVWLSSDDYPLLLGSADVGVSLHKSSSGLDLPMKVVDMYGCHLPVLAYEYACIQELVKPGKTGLLFTDYKELARHLQTVLKGFPTQQHKLQHMRQEIRKAHTRSWAENWDMNFKLNA